MLSSQPGKGQKREMHDGCGQLRLPFFERPRHSNTLQAWGEGCRRKAMADKLKIGKIYDLPAWEVERGKIRELVESIGDGNPIFVNRESAIQSGYRDTPAPPTYATIPMMSTGILIHIIHDLKVHYANLLHGEERYEYLREIYPGNLLSGTIRVASIEEKRGKTGTLELIRLETFYRNQKDEAVLKGSSLFIERK